MPLLRNLPIRRKLMLIAMATTGGALLVAGAALVYFDLARFRSEMTSDLTTLADIVAENSNGALTFHDQADAADVLGALRLQDSIAAAALYDVHGRLFASYAPRPGTPFPPRPGRDGARLEADGVVVFRPVWQGDERIGSVYLRSDLDELFSRIRAQAISVGAVFFAAAVLALLLSSRLQRLVSRPILSLARTARAVAEQGDTSLRADKLGDDELGHLVDDFNHMLAQIQDRDTELRRAKDERERLLALEQAARQQAEEANRLKDEFLATLSHELRTPLNAILGWVQVLRTGKLDEATSARALETIERNGRAQAQLIGDLLDVSRIITGKLRLDFRPVELYRIIDAALASVWPAAEAKGIELAVDCGPLASPVLGDADRLQQVVWNLLSNGIKFTPRGGRMEVLLREAAGSAVLQVSDTGIGVRPDFLPYVFDRFRQAEGSISRTHAGLGLGLSIVRHLVELHGGTVAVDSAGEGQGATLTVQLPLRAELTAGLPPAGERRRGAGPPPASGLPDLLKDLRVLVVEDEVDTRDLLVMALRQSGAEVAACASVPEALAAFDRLPPDVLVSDIGFPEEDGYSLIRKIRSRDPVNGGRVPAAALTAYARREDRLRAFEAGYQKHLAKPLDPAELVAAVAQLAGR